MELPQELIELFKKTSFMPHSLVDKERLYHNDLMVEHDYEGWPDTKYPEHRMFYVLIHPTGQAQPASKAFADWGSTADADFVTLLVHWLKKELMSNGGRSADTGAADDVRM